MASSCRRCNRLTIGTICTLCRIAEKEEADFRWIESLEESRRLRQERFDEEARVREVRRVAAQERRDAKKKPKITVEEIAPVRIITFEE